MRILSIFRHIFLVSILCRPLHAFNGDLPCPHVQPIAIHLGLDSIIAAYAYSLNNISTVAAVPLQGNSNETLLEYKNSTELLRQAFWVQDKRKRVKDDRWDLPIISPVINAISTMRNFVSGTVTALVEISDSRKARKVLRQWEMMRESFHNTVSMILTHFQYFPQSETEPELPSDEYIKTGFVKAFEHLKDVSRENTEIEIASVHIVLVPDFFDFRIRMLVNDAAEAARVNPNGVMIISPQDMIKAYPGCLDDEITKMPILDPVRTEETVMIVDYGMTYLHLHTQSKRCRMKIALDSYSCSRVAILLFYRVLSLGGPLSRQIEQGASKPQLFEALWRAKFAMEQTTETPWDVDSQDHYEEWPLDLQNWWIDEEEDAVLRWEDVQAIEDEYIDELAEYLDQALDCLQGVENEHGVRSNPIDRVFMLGNFCNRPIVKRAIRKSVGDHVKIIGGNSEQDNGLALKGGARYAYAACELVMQNCESDGQPEMYAHEEL